MCVCVYMRHVQVNLPSIVRDAYIHILLYDTRVENDDGGDLNAFLCKFNMLCMYIYVCVSVCMYI